MKIKVFTTGGSIDKIYSTRESNFVVDEPQVKEIFQQANVVFDYEIESLFRKDSLELNESDRKLVAQEVRALSGEVYSDHAWHGYDDCYCAGSVWHSWQGNCTDRGDAASSL